MPWTDTGEIALHYRVLGDESAPPVLLLHELGGSAQSWSYLAPRLAGSRCVYALDMRGAGLSEKPAGPYSIATLADDALAFMARTRPATAWDVIGSAFGAFVAIDLAARADPALRSLTLSAAVAGLDQRTKDYLLERVARIAHDGMASVAATSLANSFPAGTPFPDDAGRAEYAFLFRCQDPAAYSALSGALARHEHDPDLVRRITVPTLVLSGERDFIWPPTAVEMLARLIPGSRFAVIAEAGHFPHLQDPQSFAARVNEFWAGIA